MSKGKATKDWMAAMKMLTESVYGASAGSDEFLRMISSDKASLDVVMKGLGKVDPATAVTEAYKPGDVISTLIAEPYEYKAPSELEGLFYGTPTHGKTRDGIHSEESFKKILGGSTSAYTGRDADVAFDMGDLKRSIDKLQGESLLREPIGGTPKKPEVAKSDVPVDVGEHVGSW